MTNNQTPKRCTLGGIVYRPAQKNPIFIDKRGVWPATKDGKPQELKGETK